jgi:Putative glucoamylase/Protein of unknown function (DUF3131)
MNRAVLARLLSLCLTLVGSMTACVVSATEVTPSASRLTSEERTELLIYARDTWRSFDRLAFASGLPADSMVRDATGWVVPSLKTSPTDIAAYLWSVLAAERLKIIGHEEGQARLKRTLETLERMERFSGFYFNDLDPRTGDALRFSPLDRRPRRRLLSVVDNAWLATALTMVANVEPALRPQAGKLLNGMNFGFFYDPYDPAHPNIHPGQLHVGCWADDRSFYGHYGMLNSEARIASYVGIARSQLPRDAYYRMYRTLPDRLGPQEQKPAGQTREYLGVKVFEGSYSYRNMRIVPSWGGSMFEALMVTLFVPEDVWAPRSWGVNHPLYVDAQIEHGLDEAHYGFWGFSPASSPRGGYRVYGVKALGTDPQGYRSYDPAAQILPPFASLAGRFNHGVITPHASFLALRFRPRQAMTNLHALLERAPIYGPLGFQDSVDVSAGIVSGTVLAVDQGMIMAAIANELAGNIMQHAFSDGLVEQSIRPLIAMEEFSAGRAAGKGHSLVRLSLLR